MDNKITKSRLSNFLAYEWIIMAVVLAVIIVGWELLYSVTSVRLNYGQEFYFIFDLDMYSENRNVLKKKIKTENVFSYDVLEINTEALNDSASARTTTDVLSIRVASGEGDAISTNIAEQEEISGYKPSRAKTLIDGAYCIKDYQYYYDTACYYLSLFLKDGETDYTDYSKLDENKIKERFLLRLKNDNRYRYNEISEKDDYLRIEKLCGIVKDLKKILDYNDGMEEDKKIFFSYIRFEQASVISTNPENREQYKALYEKEKLKGPKNYGLRIDRLPTAKGKLNTAEYFKIKGNVDSADTVLMLFDFLEDDVDFSKETKWDLHFEKLGFITYVVKNFSTILD